MAHAERLEGLGRADSMACPLQLPSMGRMITGRIIGSASSHSSPKKNQSGSRAAHLSAEPDHAHYVAGFHLHHEFCAVRPALDPVLGDVPLEAVPHHPAWP